MPSVTRSRVQKSLGDTAPEPPSVSRRDFLKRAAALAAGAGSVPADARAQGGRAPGLSLTPEKGARLRVLRWKRFVQGDEDVWMANTARFAQTTAIPVRVDYESWEDVRPKAAVTANLGSGPDIVVGFFDDPHLYPDRLVDLTDLANHLGAKYGGWYETCVRYGTRDGRWIGLPLGSAGIALVYRESHVKAAGFATVPNDTAGFLKLCQALKARGTPPGFALGNAVGDANAWAHWLVWSHGGKLVDERHNVVIHSPETVHALQYAKALGATFVPGTRAWLDADNNAAFLDGRISLTANGISIYYAAKDDPKLAALARDIQHASLPVGPIGRPTELSLLTQAMVFRHTRYPQAAKAYLRFMWEREQYAPWQEASIGYITQPLRAYEASPVWTADPKHAPFRNATAAMLYHGHAGRLGYASAAAMADYIIVNMVADVVTGALPPGEAAERARRRAERYYKV
jgi:multiple sugar transport system substrate-binding protein